MIMRIRGICPKCNEFTALTKHHIKPKRFFGKRNNTDWIYICRDCHDDLEKLIPLKELQPVEFYYNVVELFLMTPII